MHSPHYRAQPPGWLRSRADRLWRRLVDGRTARPCVRWTSGTVGRVGIYGAGGALLLVIVGCQLGPKPEPLAPVDEEALALIEAGADLNAPLDETGATALHRVAAGGTPPVATALMDAGADPNLPALATGQPRASARTFAVAAAEDECTGFYAINQPVVFQEGHCHVDAYGPLHHAARRNSNSEMIQTLIDGGADPDGRGYRHTPLHEAVWREDAAQIVMALIDGGADPNRGRDHYDQHPDGINRGDNTPLCWATHARQTQATVETTIAGATRWRRIPAQG